MDRKFIITALLYAVVGMLIGIHMAATHNHLQHVTHAHILLVGFVVSFIYALCHKFDAAKIEPVLAISSILVLVALILMLMMVLKNTTTD